MQAWKLRSGMALGRFRVHDVKNDSDPWVPFDHVGVLLFDTAGRDPATGVSYSRHLFKRRDTVDVANLPGWS